MAGQHKLMSSRMRTSRLLLWLPWLVVLLTGPVCAQMRIPTLIGVWNPIGGAGAVYDVTASDGSHSSMDLSVVGVEARGAWLEIVTRVQDEDVVIKQLLSPRGAVLGLVAQVGTRPPVVLPEEGVVGGGVVSVRKGRLVSREVLRVGGRSFRCERYRIVDGDQISWDVWVTPNVPPLNVVRLRSSTLTLALQKQYGDARTRITETPQPMEMP